MDGRRAIMLAARTAVAAAVASAVAAAALVAVRGDRIAQRLARGAEECRAALLGRLRSWHGLEFYAPLDERSPVEMISGEPLLCRGAVRIRGVAGSARRFGGERGQVLVARRQRWAPFAREGFTLSLWLQVPGGSGAGARENRIVWDRVGGSGFGLRTRAGLVEVVFGDGAGDLSLSAPVPSGERFFHVAFVAGGGRAALFVDGVERASCPVQGPVSLHSHFVSAGTDGHFPPSAALDEWCIWKRPLESGEIMSLAAAGKPVPALFEPELASRLGRLERRLAVFRAIRGAFGCFTSSTPSRAVLNRGIPAVELRLSKADRRHFRDAQLEAVSSGFRTSKGMRDRWVEVLFGGRSGRARAWLDETVPENASPSRPAFVLHSRESVFGNASGAVRLFPPEQYGARHPDAAMPLPLDASVLVRLLADGEFLGFYCLEPFECGAPPWFATGPRDASRPDRVHFSAAAGAAAAGAGMTEGERRASWRKILALLWTDRGFPLGASDAEALAAAHSAARAESAISDPEPGPEAFLGANPAALFVTGDLDLSAAGPDTRWESSAPETISETGRVTRPGDGRPRFVELAATGPRLGRRTFRFRVMPRRTDLPALFLWFGRPLDKRERSDFACLRVPAGEAGAGGGEWLFGTAPRGGGAKLRGNTSYVAGRRRSINLEFDEPVEIPGAGIRAGHLLLHSGYSDATRLRNALSSDIFRAMEGEGPVRSTPFSWAEVFVNGAYAGVWEASPRLRDCAGEAFSCLFKVRSPRGLWTNAEESSEIVDRVDASDSSAGAGGGPDAYGPFRQIVGIVSGTPAGDFAALARDLFDMDELVDFFLLVNFTGNEDGRVTNQFVARRASDGRWVLLPWDYDKTFLDLPDESDCRRGLLVSPLFARLFEADPGLRQRVAARWRELRAGPLREEALLEWIDGRSRLLAPFMDEDFRVVPPLGHGGDYDDAVETLRAQTLLRLRLMDAWLLPGG